MGVFLEVEKALSIPHIGEGPTQDIVGESDVVLAEILELGQGDQALSDTVDVDRIGGVMIIPWRAVLPEKMGSIKIKPAANGRIELRCSRIVMDPSQGDEIEARMEVVDPSLSRCLAVIPGAVRVLLADGVARGVEGGSR